MINLKEDLITQNLQKMFFRLKICKLDSQYIKKLKVSLSS